MSTVALNSKEGKWVMASAILASSMAFIDGSALNVVLPTLQENLHATSGELFWLLNSYMLMLASLILIGGSLGDILGRRKIFMYGIIIFIIGSCLCGLAPDIFFLIIFRVIQGIGGALMIPGSLSLISSSINEKERGKAIGTWSAITTMVSVGGPVLGGALADAGLWRYIFFINIPIGMVAIFILWKNVKETEPDSQKRSIDISGAITLALGLALITFGLLRLPVVGINNWQIYTSLISGVVLLLMFLRIEQKSKNPMMPLTLFKNLTFSSVNLLTFFLYAGLGAGTLFLSLNFVQVQHYTQLQSGLTFLPFTVIMILLARFAGGLADKYGPRLFLIFGPATAGTGLLFLSFIKQTQGAGEYWTTFFPGILIFSLGMAFTVAPLTAVVMASVTDKLSGTASGVNNAISRLSNVFANAVFGALAIVFFSGSLQQHLQSSQLTAEQKQQVMAQAINLGDAKVPAGLDPARQASVTLQFHSAFIHAYGSVLFLAAMLCFTAALIALLWVKNTASKK